MDSRTRNETPLQVSLSTTFVTQTNPQCRRWPGTKEDSGHLSNHRLNSLGPIVAEDGICCRQANMKRYGDRVSQAELKGYGHIASQAEVKG